ncbi:MAG: 30S ribosomal protein S16 [Actinomycetota bacterium]
MVRIRLMRVGKTKQPTYRVVVADQRSPRDGRIIESIGHYNPRIEPSFVAIDTERADYWLGVGAQPSAQVRKLIEIARSGGDGAPEQTPSAKATRAGSVKATPAASVAEDEGEAGVEPAVIPEAEPEEATEEETKG